jgi:hypothetical protein
MNIHAFVSRVRIHPGSRRLVAVAALVCAFGALGSCNDDDFSSNSPTVTVNVPNSIAVADVNGVPDLLVATTADQGSPANPGFANVILNTPSSPGTFQPGVQYAATGTDPSSIAVADLTGSGALDMVMAMAGSGNVSVFMHGASSGTFMPAVNVNSGGLPNQVVIGDLSGASAPGQCAPRCDLVLADLSAAGNVIVLKHGATAGTFMPPLNLPTGVVVTSVQIGDLNGDGLPDIVAATYDDNGNNGAVYVFLQNKDGTFASPVIFPAGAQPQSVKIADVNGDGRPDLIVANMGPGSDGTGLAGVSVLLQAGAPNPPGNFLAPVTYPTAGSSIDVAVGPLGGAGQPPDLVVANLAPYPTGSVSVLLHGTTPGTFQAATNYQGFGQPLAVAIHDLNNDGLPDIAVADGASATVLLQIASAPGTFAPAVQVGLPAAN